MSALVKINGVHKNYTRGSERIDVLKGVTLDIPQGDFLALMGPSGSGKTTLLNMLGGLDQPSSGTLEIAGTNIGALSGGQLSKAERMKRVGIALKVVGLAERAKHYPRQLSGGQEQRVGIARAIVTDPTLLLADEPTGDLDRKAGDEILDLLQALNRDHGKTIVMVTHDPRAAERAKRTLHLEKGQLMEGVVHA